jgi:hypothetical protein
MTTPIREALLRLDHALKQAGVDKGLVSAVVELDPKSFAETERAVCWEVRNGEMWLKAAGREGELSYMGVKFKARDRT